MITVYSKPDCPKCHVLKLKLNQKSIEYSEIQDVDKMVEMNILSLPMMDVDGTLLTFEQAVKYVNER